MTTSKSPQTPPSANEVPSERVRVGSTLRTLRETRGWGLGQLANEVGISYSYLSNIEAGRKPLTDKLLARVAKALEVEQIAIKRPGSREVA